MLLLFFEDGKETSNGKSCERKREEVEEEDEGVYMMKEKMATRERERKCRQNSNNGKNNDVDVVVDDEEEERRHTTSRSISRGNQTKKSPSRNSSLTHGCLFECEYRSATIVFFFIRLSLLPLFLLLIVLLFQTIHSFINERIFIFFFV